MVSYHLSFPEEICQSPTVRVVLGPYLLTGKCFLASNMASRLSIVLPELSARLSIYLTTWCEVSLLYVTWDYLYCPDCNRFYFHSKQYCIFYRDRRYQMCLDVDQRLCPFTASDSSLIDLIASYPVTIYTLGNLLFVSNCTCTLFYLLYIQYWPRWPIQYYSKDQLYSH